MLCGDGTVVMRVVGRCSRSHLRGRTAAMVIGTAERHGRGRSTLGGNCQHQQPDQKRSDQHIHPSTLLQHDCCARTKTSPPQPLVWAVQCRRAGPTQARHQDDRFVIFRCPLPPRRGGQGVHGRVVGVQRSATSVIPIDVIPPSDCATGRPPCMRAIAATMAKPRP